MNKKFLGILFAISIAFTFSLKQNAKATDKVKNVYIGQFIEHKALNQTRDGVIEALRQEGYVNGQNLNLKIENAQGSTIISNQIAKKFLSNEPDVLVSIPTTISQVFQNAIKNKNVNLVFASVTDPISAGLVESKKANTNITGVSNFVDLTKQIGFFKEIMPNLKRLGTIYNPSEDNSVYMLDLLKKKAEALGLEIIEAQATNSVEISQATISLIDKKVDAIFINNDNNALSSFTMITRIATNNKIPVFVSDVELINSGALAALGPDQFNIGMQAGKMVARILNGEKVEDIKVEYPETIIKCINKKVSKKLSIKIDEEIIKSADKVIG